MKKNSIELVQLFFCLCAICIVSCKEEKVQSENIQNAQAFFKTLASDSGTWTYQPNDSLVPFTKFIMKFKINGEDTLKGIISGVHKNGDTIPFWNVKETIDYKNHQILFEQIGSVGSAKDISTFQKPTVRKCEFEIIYSDSSKEKHKDVHTFISVNEILTESEIYDIQKDEWVKQPSAKWKKKMD